MILKYNSVTFDVSHHKAIKHVISLLSKMFCAANSIWSICCTFKNTVDKSDINIKTTLFRVDVANQQAMQNKLNLYYGLGLGS